MIAFHCYPCASMWQWPEVEQVLFIHVLDSEIIKHPEPTYWVVSSKGSLGSSSFSCGNIRNGFVWLLMLHFEVWRRDFDTVYCCMLQKNFMYSTKVVLLIFHSNTLDSEVTLLLNFNLHSVFWTAFISVLLSLHEYQPVLFRITPTNITVITFFYSYIFVFFFSFHFSLFLKFLRFIFCFCLFGLSFSRWLYPPLLRLIPLLSHSLLMLFFLLVLNFNITKSLFLFHSLCFFSYSVCRLICVHVFKW